MPIVKTRTRRPGPRMRRCKGCGREFRPPPEHPQATCCSPACRAPTTRRITDPTPAEIADRAAEVRLTWSEAEREARAARQPVPWRLPRLRDPHPDEADRRERVQTAGGGD